MNHDKKTKFQLKHIYKASAFALQRPKKKKKILLFFFLLHTVSLYSDYLNVFLTFIFAEFLLHLI